MSRLLAICAAECLCDAPLSGCSVVFGGWFRCPVAGPGVVRSGFGVFSTRRCLRVFPMVLGVFVWVGVACGPVLV